MALLAAGDFNRRTKIHFTSFLPACHMCNQREKNSRPQTVLNRLREAGLRACRPVVRQVLTKHHRQRRLWAQTYRRWTRQDLQKVLFADKSRFCLTRGDGQICVYRRRNELYTEACTLEWDQFGGGGSVMIWGGVSQHHQPVLVCRQSQRCALQGRPPPSCGTLPAGSS